MEHEQRLEEAVRQEIFNANRLGIKFPLREVVDIYNETMGDRYLCLSSVRDYIYFGNHEVEDVTL